MTPTVTLDNLIEKEYILEGKLSSKDDTISEITSDLILAIESGSKKNIQTVLHSLDKQVKEKSKDQQKDYGLTVQQETLYGKVQDLMNKYLKGAIPQSELVRQLKILNNILADNIARDSKTSITGNTGLATSYEYKPQPAQYVNPLGKSLDDVKATGVQEEQQKIKKYDAKSGTTVEYDAQATPQEQEQKEQEVKNLQQRKEDQKQQEQTNNITQILETNKVAEQSRRVAQEHERQIINQEKDAIFQGISAEQGQIGAFMRTSKNTSTQRDRYLERSRSRASVGEIPRIDKDQSKTASKGQSKSLIQGTRDSGKKGKHYDRVVRSKGSKIASSNKKRGK